MTRLRLDHLVNSRGLVASRSQAESWIRLGKVTVDGRVVKKPGTFVDSQAKIELTARERYVSRAGLKLASVAGIFGVDFTDRVVLDVGSSTGGFTDYALQHGARRVIAVDVGTEQLHPSLRSDMRIELHEKTDIRGFQPDATPDIVVIDVSFISVRDILPHITSLVTPDSLVIAMVKPQFEAGRAQIGNSGVVKNDRMRRDILKDFEQWSRGLFRIETKADSEVAGSHGNLERFYLLRKLVK